MRTKFILLIVFSFFSYLKLNAQSINDFQSHQSGNWNQTSTWERWDGTTWVNPAPFTPTSSEGSITILNSHIVSVSAAVSADQLVINTGGQITTNPGIALSVVNGSGDDLTINGTFLNSGTLSISTGTMKVNSGATFIHNTTSAISSILNVTTFDINSNFIYQGSSTLTPSISISGRTFGNLSFVSTSGSWSTTPGGNSAISCNNLNVGTGVTINNNNTANFLINGDLTIDGSFISISTQIFKLQGTSKIMSGISLTNFFDSLYITSGASYSVQNTLRLSGSAGVVVDGALTVNGGINCGTVIVSGTGAFNLSSGATMEVGSSAGITLPGNATGNIRTTGGRNFNPAANYIYNGSSAQDIGSALTVVNNLTIDNEFNVSQNGVALTVNGTLTIVGSGNFINPTTFVSSNSSLTLNGPNIAFVNGSTAGFTTNSSTDLNYGGSDAGITIPTSVSTLNTLSINKGSNHVAVSSSVTVSNLILTNGNFVCSSGLVKIKATSSITGGSGSSYVNGTLIRVINTGATSSITFPVGKLLYEPIKFNNVTVSGFSALDLEVEAHESIPAGGPNTSNLHGEMTNRYWYVNTSGLSSITSIGSFALTPTTPVPILTTNNLVGFSSNNSQLSYSSIGGIVGGSTITTTLSLSSFTSAVNFTGAYIGIGENIVAGDYYAIGPGASYTQPNGDNYVAKFATLTAAVNALNNLPGNSKRFFEFQSDYVSTSETYPITITYSGTATKKAVFRARSDASSTINIIGPYNTSFGGMIVLDGADHIIFDGSPGGTLGTTRRLRFRSRDATPFRAAFYIYNDATNNLLNALAIEGGLGSSNISIGPESSGGSGNDFTTIQNCKIGHRIDSIGIPSYGIFADGSSGMQTNDVIIQNNDFVGCRDAIEVRANIGYWLITQNNIYGDGINVFNGGITVLNCGVLDFNVTNNYLGGTAPGTGGLPMLISDNSFVGIDVENAEPTGRIKVNNNKIANIEFNQVGGFAAFRGIAMSGIVTVNNNLIGDTVQTNSLKFDGANTFDFKAISASLYSTSSYDTITNNVIANVTLLNASSTTSFEGMRLIHSDISSMLVSNNKFSNIYNERIGGMALISLDNTSPSTQHITNNIFENITQTNPMLTSFTGIYCDGSAVNVSGNRFGSLTIPNSISLASNGTCSAILITTSAVDGAATIQNNTISNLLSTGSSSFTGINFSGTGSYSHSITENIINNIKSTSIKSSDETGESGDFALIGIVLNASSSIQPQLISGNLITGLLAQPSNRGFYPVVCGIFVKNGIVNVLKNKIYNFQTIPVTTSGSQVLLGIKYRGGSGSITASNNMISITNSPYSHRASIFGIYDHSTSSSVNSFFHNSVYIGGVNSGVSNSSSFWRNSTTGNVQVVNNLFHNYRSGTGSHYAIVNLTGTSWSTTASNYNNLSTSNTSTLGMWPFWPLNSDKSFAAWKAISGGDMQSINTPVVFVNNENDLHLTYDNCDHVNRGAPSSITTDIDGEARNNTTPDIGADELISAGIFYFADSDNDNYGSTTDSARLCTPSGIYTALIGGDCNDGNGLINPASTEICGNGIDENCNGQIDEGCIVTLNLKVLIQGYLLTSGTMRAVVDKINYPSICDTIIVELHNTSYPFNLIQSAKEIIDTSGSGQFIFNPSIIGQQYYIVVKHRNSLETWSSLPVNFNSSSVSYDFTTAANKAYGNNQSSLSNGKFGIWSGDITNGITSGIKDGIINFNDFIQLESQTSGFIIGYNVNDLTGDGIVDAEDYSLIENTAALGVTRLSP